MTVDELAVLNEIQRRTDESPPEERSYTAIASGLQLNVADVVDVCRRLERDGYVKLGRLDGIVDHRVSEITWAGRAALM